MLSARVDGRGFWAVDGSVDKVYRSFTESSLYETEFSFPGNFTAMRARQFARFALLGSIAAALLSAAAPTLAMADPIHHAPATPETLSNDMLTAAREASGTAQAQGLSAPAAKRLVEGAIFGVIAKSGADYSTNLGALRLAKIGSGDPVILSAVLAAMAQVEASGGAFMPGGCSACSAALTTGQGSGGGGAGTPAYSRRGPT
jgi:hypothetical protein